AGYFPVGSSASSGGRSFGSDQKDVPARLWDAETGQRVATLTPPESTGRLQDQTTCAAFSPDGRFVVTGYYGTRSVDQKQLNALHRWDARTGLHLGQRDRLLKDHHVVQSLSLNADGTKMLVVYQRSDMTQLLEVQQTDTGKLLASRTIPIREDRRSSED